MPIDYDSLDEGDTLNAVSLNSRITSLQTGVNDLEKVDIEEKALRSEHLSSLIRSDDFTPPGMTKGSFTPDVTTNAYDTRIGPGAAPTRTVLGLGPLIGGAPGPAGFSIISCRPAPIATLGPLIGGTLGTFAGFSIISCRPAPIATPGPWPPDAQDCNIGFSPSVDVVSSTTPATGFSNTTYCTALLVRLNVAIIFKSIPAGPEAIVMGLVWEADGALGTYNYLEQAETGVEVSTGKVMGNYSDLSTCALITSGDTGGSLVARISGVISNVNGGTFTIREWNISVIPIFGGTL